MRTATTDLSRASVCAGFEPKRLSHASSRVVYALGGRRSLGIEIRQDPSIPHRARPLSEARFATGNRPSREVALGERSARSCSRRRSSAMSRRWYAYGSLYMRPLRSRLRTSAMYRRRACARREYGGFGNRDASLRRTDAATSYVGTKTRAVYGACPGIASTASPCMCSCAGKLLTGHSYLRPIRIVSVLTIRPRLVRTVTRPSGSPRNAATLLAMPKHPRMVLPSEVNSGRSFTLAFRSTHAPAIASLTRAHLESPSAVAVVDLQQQSVYALAEREADVVVVELDVAHRVESPHLAGR